MPQDLSQKGPASPDQGKIAEFLRLAEEMDRAENALATAKDANRAGAETVLKETRSKLQTFIGGCSEEDRRALGTFFLRQQEFMHVEQARDLAHSKITRVLNWLPHTVGAVSEPIARLSGETMRLLATTLGLTAYGLYRGAKTTYNVFSTAA